MQHVKFITKCSYGVPRYAKKRSPYQYSRDINSLLITRCTVIAFVPSNFVCVAWDGLKAEISDDVKVRITQVS